MQAPPRALNAHLHEGVRADAELFGQLVDTEFTLDDTHVDAGFEVFAVALEVGCKALGC